MKKILVILVLLCSLCQAIGKEKNALLLLDSELEKKELYDARKEARIDSLRRQKFSSSQEQYDIYDALFNEYASYKYDSAYSYSNRLRELAISLHEKDKIVHAGCSKVFCLLSAGFFKEAFEEAEKINPEGCSAEALVNYYQTMVRLNYSIADYNYEEDWLPEYLKTGHDFSEKLLALLDQRSQDWHYHHADLLMKSGRTAESVGEFTYLMDQDIDLHRRAIVASCLGWMYLQNNDTEKAVEYLANAAICDLQSSTKETTALRMLADVLSRLGQIDRPTRYVRESFDDANFYNARLRKIEVGAVLPIIEQNRNDSLQRQKDFLLIGIIVAILIILAAIAAIIFIRRQNRKLDSLNAKLAEADDIKTAYIGSSFYQNAEYIDKISILYKTVDRMLITKQYEELRRSVKESAINKERDRMYESFDNTFLTIFPSFVQEYNALFKEEDQVHPQNGLSTEMRIFALIRLGITESDRIAKFLDYSVHTINTYKTRVKNKSLVENDSFEEQIMTIGIR